jgi:hypothetical protein
MTHPRTRLDVDARRGAAVVVLVGLPIRKAADGDVGAPGLGEFDTEAGIEAADIRSRGRTFSLPPNGVVQKAYLRR